ncbi:hypothetical protein SmJEL517_g04448 [Synchytrium microbalum]|uniref:OBG-type G domain-containing protein n=1 Tax=Synchytrium microbalum TaxID=1806994 RepID=A0A507BTW0_9FUNG|nr:uncharacterized protein SmJEL517_g04448 [Synchytrium microbalum]TPX32407.1 hypothetical protein SmJEL517_g04448 [Synchytrium microbalum]
MKDVLIACVGKPSAGKSSFLNALTDATSKVGNFPFTTITPNTGVAYCPFECPCKRFGKQAQCRPRYGKCVDGKRFVPVRILDVAGLVPGASEGAGLGNQFLDDLRTADGFIHVVDVSGTTDQDGKETLNYDPINDIDWLISEIRMWILNNLLKKWNNTVRRHVATKQAVAETLQLQLSGYGCNLALTQKVLDKSGIKDPLEAWDDGKVKDFVDTFLDVRFPTVVALNKIDLPDSDKNIDRICRRYDQSKIVLTSALAENFLRRLHKQRFINYVEGADHFELSEDQPPDTPDELKLKPLDEKTRSRLEKVQDLVLFRYGNTGVTDTLKRAVELLGVIPAFPVKNINNFSGEIGRDKGIFRDCILIRPGTTVREFAKLVSDQLYLYYWYAETVGNVRMGEDDIVTLENNIISFKTTQALQPSVASGGGGKTLGSKS